jgi:sulfite exporter TauE/SafE
MRLMEALLLGLSTGTSCLILCGPIIVPYLLGEGISVKRSLIDIFIFLGSRFIVYILLGLLAALVGQTFLKTGLYRGVITGSAYIILSVTLIIYAFFRIKPLCMLKNFHEIPANQADRRTLIVPLVGGLVTGLSLCPSLLLAFTGAASEKSIWQSITFFILFFIGTTVYFLPLIFLGLIHGKNVIHIIGKIAAGMAGVIFFAKGLILLINSFST